MEEGERFYSLKGRRFREVDEGEGDGACAGERRQGSLGYGGRAERTNEIVGASVGEFIRSETHRGNVDEYSFVRLAQGSGAGFGTRICRARRVR